MPSACRNRHLKPSTRAHTHTHRQPGKQRNADKCSIARNTTENEAAQGLSWHQSSKPRPTLQLHQQAPFPTPSVTSFGNPGNVCFVLARCCFCSVLAALNKHETNSLWIPILLTLGMRTVMHFTTRSKTRFQGHYTRLQTSDESCLDMLLLLTELAGCHSGTA